MALDAQLERWCDREAERHVAALSQLIAVPSVSADPARRADVAACCDRLVSAMAEIGLEARVLTTGGNPLAFARYDAGPDRPTLLVYGHYDVQPVDPLELWDSPPFQATIRDGKLFGRGAVDDKGQVAMHLAAAEAHLRVRGRLPINLKIVVEGEEEIGSPNFEAAAHRYRDELSSDAIVISDTAMYALGVPALTTSLRGLVHWEIAVHGPSQDLHSGYFGGQVRNPIEVLAGMLSALKDRDGRITVPGFYDGVQELSEERQAALDGLPFDEANEARRLGVPQLNGGERGRSALERSWFRPTLECNGIWGGYSGPGSKTIVPSWAKAKLSARLVGTQNPNRISAIVKAYLERNAPPGVRVNVTSGDGAVAPMILPTADRVVRAAARALEAVFGKPPAHIGTGGSIGPVAIFDRVFGVPQVLIGVGLPDDNIHAPNEKFDLAQFFGGIKAIAAFYDEYGREEAAAAP